MNLRSERKVSGKAKSKSGDGQEKGPDTSAASVTSAPLLPVVGDLEGVSEQGWVFGWAWCPARPDERIELEVLVDGKLADTILAANYRVDVAEAGFGDGYYGYSWPLSYSVLAQPHDAIISVRVKQSGQILPKPWVFRQKLVANAVHKIAELENDVRLLKGTIAELSRRSRQDDEAAGELFKIVGDFFAELAAATAAGAPPRQLRTLKAAVADVTTTFAAFAFHPCATPNVTILVSAGGSAEIVYETLRALHDTIGNTVAEIVLLDDGTCDDAALLPLAVQNMRYMRLTGGNAVARYNDAIRMTDGELLVFFAAGVKPAPRWVDALTRFQAEAGLAALAARVTRPDGQLLHAGVEQREGAAILRGQGMESKAFAENATVDAVCKECFALRRSAWTGLGGLDEGFDDIAPALINFCLDSKAAGNTVGYTPEFGASSAE
jgi:hypothetical protein